MMVVDRNKSLDVGCGVMVVWMILYHTFQNAQISDALSNTLFGIFYFFMPWFFYKAGIFWKAKPIRKVLKTGIKRLLIPYLIFSILGHIVWCVQIWTNGDYNWKHYVLSPFKAIITSGAVAGNMPLWFLFSLFFIRVLFTLLKKLKISELIIIGCSGAGCFLLHLMKIQQPIYLMNIMSGMFFFTIGKVYPPPPPMITKRICLISFIIYISIMFICPSWVLMFNNELVKGYYLLYIVYSVSGIFVFNYLCEYKFYRFRLLEIIGKDSMGYYVSHALIINILTIVNKEYFHLEGYNLFVVYVLALMLTLPIITMILKKQRII